MHLKLPLGVNFNVRVLCKWCGRYRSQNTSWNMYTCMDESCICGHHVSKDFCTPIINEVCSGSQEGKFWRRTHPRKVSYCPLLLQTGTITATVRDSRHYFNNLLQGELEDGILHFFIYGCSACWSLCWDNEFNFDTRKLLVYHFCLNTAAMTFNFLIIIVIWREENDM